MLVDKCEARHQVGLHRAREQQYGHATNSVAVHAQQLYAVLIAGE